MGVIADYSPSAPGGLTPLQKYADDISSAVKVIDAYCTSEGVPQPSFDPRAPSVTIPSSAPLAVLEARQKLVASAERIQQLATEPAEYLPHLGIHFQRVASFRWLWHFGVIARIPLDGSISYSELAAAAGVPESQLKSMARMAITSNLLCEPEPDKVGHNAASALFVTSPKLADWARFMNEYSIPSAAASIDATAKWGATAEKNETAFNLATKTELPLFDYFAQTPELAGFFAAYMKSVQVSQGVSLKHLLTGFDWAGLGEATVVDVGGSTCSSSIALAEAFPQLKFIVEDLPDTISGAASLLAAQPESLRSRISTQSYDFFTPQGVAGADVYFFRMIFHDWPAREALTILRGQLAALRANPRARLVVMDTVLPPPGSTSTVEEALLRVRDLTMAQAFNSRERERGEFEALFAQASDGEGRLVLKNLVKPPGSVMSVMEVVYEAFDGAPAELEAQNGAGTRQSHATNGTNGSVH